MKLDYSLIEFTVLSTVNKGVPHFKKVGGVRAQVGVGVVIQF